MSMNRRDLVMTAAALTVAPGAVLAADDKKKPAPPLKHTLDSSRYRNHCCDVGYSLGSWKSEEV